MLHYLTEEEFARRTAGGARTPVYREFLADRETPVSVLTRVTDDDAVFLLESVSGGENRGRYSSLGLDPYETFMADGPGNPLAPSRAKVLGRPWGTLRSGNNASQEMGEDRKAYFIKCLLRARYQHLRF